MARPKKPLISKPRAVAAALKQIDKVGLEEFGLDGVAKSLGVRTPSLYTHFRDRADLLAHVARELTVAASMPETADATAPWADRILERCVAVRRTLLKHPRATPLLLTYSPQTMFTEGRSYWASNNPYPLEMHQLMMIGLEKLVFGSVFHHAAILKMSSRAHDLVQSPGPDHWESAVAASAFKDEEAIFKAGVRALLDGFHDLYVREFANPQSGKESEPKRVNPMRVEPAD